jgi:hypothetical protein
MILYEVNLTVDEDVAGVYAEWLGPHVEEILALDGFVSAEWWAVEAEGPGAHYSVQYRVKIREHLEAYFRDHATRMRADGQHRFGGRFTAERRILGRIRAFD